jgi:transposase InsO family protein
LQKRKKQGQFEDPAFILRGYLIVLLNNAQVLIESWRQEYNTIRPHSALNYRPQVPEAVFSTAVNYA